MWILSLIPDSFLIWFINIVLISGIVTTVAGFFFGFVPGVNRHKLVLQIVGVALLVAGVYFKGGYAIEQEWRARVAELEAKLKIAEEKSREVNVQIETQVVEKVKLVKQNVEVIKKEIQVEKVAIDQECKLTPKAKEIHNKATVSNIDGVINVYE